MAARHITSEGNLESKVHLQRSEKQIKSGECLLPLGSESFVFLSLLQQLQDILLSILCRCETWSLTLSNEHGLRVSEKGVVRRIFGPKTEEVAGC
jgi:hypothetical protein